MLLSRSGGPPHRRVPPRPSDYPRASAGGIHGRRREAGLRSVAHGPGERPRCDSVNGSAGGNPSAWVSWRSRPWPVLAGTATAADRPEAGIQPRHPADPGRELLRLPRARQRRPQGRPAARPAARPPSRPAPSLPASPTTASWSRGSTPSDPEELMPPPATHQDADRRSRRTLLKRWIADGRRVSAALVVHRRRSGRRCRRSRTRRGSATRSTASSWPKLEENGPAARRPRPTAGRWPAA